MNTVDGHTHVHTKARHGVARTRRTASCLRALLPLCLLPGCSQVVTEGHISDRETGSPIPDVEIMRSESGPGAPGWKRIARTDPGGAYFIFKSQVAGGGSIKLKKPGYYPQTMRDGEFLGVSSHIMVPTGQSPDTLGADMDEEGAVDEMRVPDR